MTDPTLVFVPMSEDGGFACFLDLDADRQKAYAFTSREKAKNFIRIASQAGFFLEIDRVQPCTPGEWSDWQREKNLPDLAIDLDPLRMAQRTMDIAFDPERQNISCLTTDHPEGKIYRVNISPRTDGSNS